MDFSPRGKRRVRTCNCALHAVIALASLAPMTVKAASPPSAMSPFVKLGPQAALSGVHGSSYGLFTCQIVGLGPGPTCYDPYQIRHAYHTDLLINAGFNGKGKTIVIIDAFQSPNIVEELNVYDTF